jgi:MerR family transcriptional regulator, light-induced transcriptional regulator
MRNKRLFTVDGTAFFAGLSAAPGAGSRESKKERVIKKVPKQSGVRRDLLTPKDLALAIGTSESSIRRWVDSGAVKLSRTVGGHRRIPLTEAVRFIRERKVSVVRPDILGWPELGGSEFGASSQTDDDQLYAALERGNGQQVQGLVLGWYVGGRSLASLCDGPICSSMHSMGELWRHSEEGILVEHQATEWCAQAVARVRSMMPPPSQEAPVAIGGAPEEEAHGLASAMAATILRECGYDDTNFGAFTPIRLLAGMARERQARLVWLSVSMPPDPRAKKETAELAKQLEGIGATLVVGGQNADECAPRAASNVQVLRTMAELSAFARGFAPAGKASGAKG